MAQATMAGIAALKETLRTTEDADGESGGRLPQGDGVHAHGRASVHMLDGVTVDYTARRCR